MTFDELWNSRYRYMAQFEHDSSKKVWEDAVDSFGTSSHKFEAWWSYQSQKKSIKTLEQAALWAWTVQQCQIDSLEADVETIAKLLDIDTTSINAKDIRTIIIEKLSSQKQ